MSKATTRGFTLVELMIAVFIIGFIVLGIIGIAVWAATGDDDCCPCQTGEP